MSTRRSWKNQERLWQELGGAKKTKPKRIRFEVRIPKTKLEKPARMPKPLQPMTAWVDRKKVVHWYDEEGNKHACAQYKNNPAELTDYLVSQGFQIKGCFEDTNKQRD